MELISGFIETLKYCFSGLPGLAKSKFLGFPGLTKLVFNDFPGYIQFTNTAAQGPKSAHTKSLIL